MHAACLDGIFRKRKRLPDLFEAFRRLRRCYPGKRLLVVVDNLHNIQSHFAGPRSGDPPQQLKGYTKVELKPGESKRVTVTLDPRP